MKNKILFIPLFFIGITQLFSANSHPDLNALVALYNSTNGATWTDNTGWIDGAAGTSCDVCTWPGVSCNASNRVNGITLFNNNLNGNLPSELGDLSELTSLYIGSNNLLVGAIPPEIGNLSNLTNLNLSFNSLNGNIPPNLGNLNVGLFLLGNNNLTGNIPPELGNLSSVNSLSLQNNQLQGSIPKELANLSTLTWLRTYGNNLSGCYPTELSALCTQLGIRSTNANISDGNTLDADWEDFCANSDGQCVCHPDYDALVALYNTTAGAAWTNNTDWLSNCDPCGEQAGNSLWFGLKCNVTIGGIKRVTEVRLEMNNLTGSIPSDIKNLNYLKDLYLRDNMIGGNLPIELGELSDLRACYLSRNNINGGIPIELGNLSNLSTLDLSENNLTGSIPAELGALMNLRNLILFANSLSGNIPAELGNLENLEFLFLNENNLDGAIPIELGMLERLQRLYLSDNNLSGTLPRELSKLRQLTWFLASNNTNLVAPIPPELCVLCTQLDIRSTNANISNGTAMTTAWEDFCSNTTCMPLDIKVLLQGATNNLGEMNTALTSNNLLPSVSPYTQASSLTYDLPVPVPNEYVDWVWVGLRKLEMDGSFTLVDTKAAIVLKNGEIVMPNEGRVIFSNFTSGSSYHISVHHRNHLGIMTTSPVN